MFVYCVVNFSPNRDLCYVRMLTHNKHNYDVYYFIVTDCTLESSGSNMHSHTRTHMHTHTHTHARTHAHTQTHTHTHTHTHTLPKVFMDYEEIKLLTSDSSSSSSLC